MAERIKKQCLQPGCPNVSDHWYCDEHYQTREKRPETRPQSHQRGYGWKWRKQRQRILKRDPFCKCKADYCCGATGCVQPSTDVDHIIPKPEGSDIESNLQGMCHSCHSVKTSHQKKCKQYGTSGKVSGDFAWKGVGE